MRVCLPTSGTLLVALLVAPLARSDGDERRGPDLELLVDASSWSSDGASTRNGVDLRRGSDTGIEPAFDAGGTTDASGGATVAVAAPQLIDDFADSPPPSPAAASPSSAPLSASATKHVRARFGVLPDAEGFDQVDFWQRLADMLKVRASPTPRAEPRATRARARARGASRRVRSPLLHGAPLPACERRRWRATPSS